MADVNSDISKMNLEDDSNLLDESVLNCDIMNDDESNKELAALDANIKENIPKFAIISPTSTPDRTNTTSNSVNTNGNAIGNKIIKLSQMSTEERLELRAKRFGIPVSMETSKAARSERFSLKPVTAASFYGRTESNIDTNVKNRNSSISNFDKLRKRAERFGKSVSKEIENFEKRRKRIERLGKIKEKKITFTSESITSEQIAEKDWNDLKSHCKYNKRK